MTIEGALEEASGRYSIRRVKQNDLTRHQAPHLSHLSDVWYWDTASGAPTGYMPFGLEATYEEAREAVANVIGRVMWCPECNQYAEVDQSGICARCVAVHVSNEMQTEGVK